MYSDDHIRFAYDHFSHDQLDCRNPLENDHLSHFHMISVITFSHDDPITFSQDCNSRNYTFS